jgi:hypothetical protein
MRRRRRRREKGCGVITGFGTAGQLSNFMKHSSIIRRSIKGF